MTMEFSHVQSTDTAAPQPQPTPGHGPDIVELVIVDHRVRAEQGLAKYGTRLRAHNGRNAMVDAYQEALDQALYLRQAIAEHDAMARELLLTRDVVLAAIEHVSYIGACDHADGDTAALYCADERCTYCRMAQAVDVLGLNKRGGPAVHLGKSQARARSAQLEKELRAAQSYSVEDFL